jgi:single-strand DNA-binding protein
MASFNKIEIVGYLGRDVELRYMPDGTPVANFSVASTERRKDRTGEVRDFTTWFRITVFSNLAEICTRYLSKGKQVAVYGSLRLNEYTDRDGAVRTNLEVRANDVKFLSKVDHEVESNESDEETQDARALGAAAGSTSSNPLPEIAEDDVPF